MLNAVKHYVFRSYLLRIFLLVLALEAASSAMVYARFDWARDSENPDFLERFVFTNLFVRPFMQHRYDALRKICENVVDMRNPFPWVATRIFPPEPVYGHRLGRNQCFRRKNSVIMTNDQGFSTIDSAPVTYQTEKPDGTFRAIVIGGSTVMGLGAHTPSQNLPAYLQRRLARKMDSTGQEVQVINAGVGGYYSVNEFLYLASELVHFDPDLLIVYNGWNDSQLFPANTTRSLHGPRANPNDRVLARGYNFGGSLLAALGNLSLMGRSIVDRSATVFLIKLVVRRVGTHEKAAAVDPRAGQTAEDIARGIARYERNLRLMVSTAKIHGFRIAIFLQPLQYEQLGFESRDIFYDGAREMMDELRDEFSADLDVCVADVSSSLLGEQPGSVYYDNGHLLGKGNEIVSSAILESLQACGVLNAGGT